MTKQPTPSDLLRQQISESGVRLQTIAADAGITWSRFWYIYNRGGAPTLDEAERLRTSIRNLLAKEISRIQSLQTKYGMVG